MSADAMLVDAIRRELEDLGANAAHLAELVGGDVGAYDAAELLLALAGVNGTLAALADRLAGTADVEGVAADAPLTPDFGPAAASGQPPATSGPTRGRRLP